MRRRSQLLTHEEITDYCEPALELTITDHAAIANHFQGRAEEVPAVPHRRQQRRATMTAATSPIPPLQMTKGRVGNSSFPFPSALHRRPLTVRTILSIASVILLLLVIGEICYFSLTNNDNNNNSTIDDIKELTQTVMRLSQELHDVQLENERNRHELNIVEKAVSESKIELTWESQHVASMEESQRIMKESILEQMQKGQIKNIDTTNAASEIGTRLQQERDAQLRMEHDENIQLRVALAKSIDELDRVRRKQKQTQQKQQQQEHQLIAPIELEEDEEKSRNNTRTEHGQRLSSNSYERLLRGGKTINYLPGDSIEIMDMIEHEHGVVKIALRPGVISDINSDGSFNVFQLESSYLMKNIQREGFRLYQVYNSGTTAFYEQQPKQYVPIIIVRFIQSSAQPGLEVHGNYKFTYDADASKVIHEGRAMLMHRHANDGEIII